MASLIPIRSEEWANFNGYLDALQLMFIRGELNLTLESAFYEITNTVTDEEVIGAAYCGFNEIEYRQEVTMEHVIRRVNDTLSLTRAYWTPEYHGVPTLIENGLREGFWHRLNACFDVGTATVIELGNDVPYVNIGDGFTFIFYSPDRSRCLVLVANWSD
jgi:hypothetical protein